MALSKANIQLYAEEMKAEGMGNDMSVTLYNVDLSGLVGQVTLHELLSGWDLADVHEYVAERIEDDATDSV